MGGGRSVGSGGEVAERKRERERERGGGGDEKHALFGNNADTRLHPHLHSSP